MLTDHGLRGLECFHSSNNQDESGKLRKLAKKYSSPSLAALTFTVPQNPISRSVPAAVGFGFRRFTWMISNFLCSWLEWAEAKQLLFSIFAVPPQRSSPPAYDLPRRKLFRQPYRRLSRFPENKNHIDPGLTHCLPGSFFCGSHRLSFHLPPGLLLQEQIQIRSFSHISQTFKVRLIISFFLPENLFPQFLTYFRRYNSDLAPELQKRPHPPHRDLSAADYKHLPPLKVHKQWKICHFFRSFPGFWYIFDSPPCLRQIFPINSIKIQFRLLKFYLFRRLFFPYPSGRIQIVKRKTK